MTMGPGTVGEKTYKAMGRVGNWLGGFLDFHFPLDVKAFPWKWFLIGAAVIWLTIAVWVWVR